MKNKDEFHTSIDLPPEGRTKLSALLNAHLADTTDLYSQTKQAHWNVRGAQFFQLHELFDKFAEELEEYADLLAERVTALGHMAKGTVRMAAAASRLPEYPSDPMNGPATIKILAARYASLAKSIRAAIDEAVEYDDQSTADLFTEISRGLDKSLWFLEAHEER